jgi:DNA-binding response OmpR family regulator
MKTDALRVVIIEDNFLLAEALADGLRRLGCQIVNTVGTLDEARAAADRGDFDLAIVDLDLHGMSALPVVDALAQKGVPYILASWTGGGEIDERYRSAARVAKPYKMGEIAAAIEKMPQGLRDLAID